MLLKEIISEIEGNLEMRQAEDFDNVGLLCGNPDREITGILVCHDALEEVVNEAVATEKNLIVCFHPIIFSGLKKITGKNYVESAILTAIENKIAIYAIHTALDCDFFGVNRRICDELGLRNFEILQPKKNLQKLEFFVPENDAEKVKEAVWKAGAGNIGFYDECAFSVSGEGNFRPLENSNPRIGSVGDREKVSEKMVSVIFENFKKNKVLSALKNAHPYEEVAYQIINLENENQYSGLGGIGEFGQEISQEEFLEKLKNIFGLKVIKFSNSAKKTIKKVGVLGGSGASGIPAALAKGCDAYVTGDLKYHDYFLAENKILLCDIGHFESERFVTEQIVGLLSGIFPNFAVANSGIKTNPVNYFL